jgi:N-methylhydantoinase A
MLGEGRLAGGLTLDRELAQAALARLGAELGQEVETVAQGILRVAAAHMSDAIHEITVERGLDPRDGALMSFGGAGGLFATLLATEAGIPAIVVPPFSGNFSAWGLLGTDITQTTARTVIAPLGEESVAAAGAVLGELHAELRERPGAAAGDGSEASAALDLRYMGQEYSLTLAVPYSEEERITADAAWIGSAFEEQYGRIFGHRMEEDIEIVAVRGTLRTPMPERVRAPQQGSAAPEGSAVRTYSFSASRWDDFALVERESLAAGASLAGPALIAEATAMTYLDNGFSATVHPTGALLIDA